jgi:hypothetical protein
VTELRLCPSPAFAALRARARLDASRSARVSALRAVTGCVVFVQNSILCGAPHASALAISSYIKLGIEHGTNLRIWGCGMGMDRMVQCSMKTGWFDAERMRPAHTPFD